jgi:hypothetical protein
VPASGPPPVDPPEERIAVWHVTAISEPGAVIGPALRFRVEATLDVAANLQTVLDSVDPQAVSASLRVWLSHLR